MRHPDFVAANFDTGFIDRLLGQMDVEHRDGNGSADAALAAAAILAFEGTQQVRLPDDADSLWRRVGRDEALRGRL